MSKNSNLPLKAEIENLTSIYNLLSFINTQLDSTFQSQREYAERILNEKTLQSLKLKEENFKLFSKQNSMQNISSIDEYFLINYDKVIQTAPKVNNVLENMNDFVTNINYGLDRLYLDGNIVCDEAQLVKTLTETTESISTMNENMKEKSEKIAQLKENYSTLYDKINSAKNLYDSVSTSLSKYKHDFLGTNIEKIAQELREENEMLFADILKE